MSKTRPSQVHFFAEKSNKNKAPPPTLVHCNTRLSVGTKVRQVTGGGGYRRSGPLGITSARGTVIAAEVAVKDMYHEEPELLPAASRTHTEKGAPPTVGGDEEPVWPWEQPVWPAEVAAAAHLAMGGAISADSGDQTGQDSNISLLWITEIHLRD